MIQWVHKFFMLILQLRPENSEEFIEYLVSIGNLDEAAVKLAEVVNNVSFVDAWCSREKHLYNNVLVCPNDVCHTR